MVTFIKVKLNEADNQTLTKNVSIIKTNGKYVSKWIEDIREASLCLIIPGIINTKISIEKLCFFKSVAAI